MLVVTTDLDRPEARFPAGLERMGTKLVVKRCIKTKDIVRVKFKFFQKVDYGLSGFYLGPFNTC